MIQIETPYQSFQVSLIWSILTGIMRNKSIQGLCMHSIHKIWKGRNKHKQNEADKPLSQKVIKVIRERIEANKAS